MPNTQRVRGTLALLVGALSLAGMVGAGPVQAATAGAAAPAADAQCHWNDYPGLGGTWLCKYGRHLWTLTSGTKVGFVIGVDYTVRFRSVDTHGKLGNWTSLGGQIIHTGNANDFTLVSCEPAPYDDFAVAVIGTDGHWYAKVRHPDGKWDPSWQKDPRFVCVGGLTT